MNGWTGKTVLIDLKDEKIEEIKSDLKILQSYIGGRGLGVKLYCDLVTQNIDPLSPDNVLIFAAGPLTGTHAPLSGRHAMVSRSPLTGTIFDSSSGGFFGKDLKFAGIDAIIIKGRAHEPVYIRIEDDALDIHTAGDLWGKNVRDCTYELSRKGRVACIGRAGEKIVPIANVMNDYFHACGRGGLGAVMGSKNLKAVVVKGTRRPEIADETRFKSLCKEAASFLKRSGGLSTYGTSTLLNLMNYMKIMPAKNFRNSEFTDAYKVSGEFIKENYDIKGQACYNCTIGCKHVIKSGLYEGYEIPEYETLWSFGPDNNNSDIGTIIRANRICNDYGIDTISSGSTIAAYAEIIDSDIEDLAGCARKIGENIEIGEKLGKGSRYISGSGKTVSMHCKGLELPGYDPRGLIGMALAYATSNRGGCHLKAYMAGPEVLGRREKVDRLTFTGKPELVKSVQDETAVIDSLVLCKFASFSISNDLFADMLSAATGIDYSINQFLECGDRIWNIERLFNNKMGFTKEDDMLPERFFEKGGIDKILFQRSIGEYYSKRGWDDNGIPQQRKLDDLGIKIQE